METEGAPLWISKEALEKAEKQSAEILEKMSPAGFVAHELLDLRRRQFGIPDSAFRVQAAFNMVYVHQIQDVMFEKGTYGDSKIIIPKNYEDSKKKSAPRGIIVSAGLNALDILRSNGMDLGHIINYVRVAPFRLQYDIAGGEVLHLLTLHVGDIYGSEDTATALRERRIALTRDQDVNGVIIHRYRGADGVALEPETPGSE
jgi:hypothetical protein